MLSTKLIALCTVLAIVSASVSETSLNKHFLQEKYDSELSKINAKEAKNSRQQEFDMVNTFEKDDENIYVEATLSPDVVASLAG